MDPQYFHSLRLLLLRDSPQAIDFHITSGDYFLYLATLMGALEEALEKVESSAGVEKERALARSLRHDLRYVHANYQITPRSLADIRTIHPSGNLLIR
jgi:hypothetical protein